MSLNPVSYSIRLFHIGRIIFKYQLFSIALDVSPPQHHRFLRFCSRIWPWQAKLPKGIRLRLALEELGPIYIKLGQSLSTRADIFPEDILNELAKLQDRVPPFPSREAKQIIEESLGQPLNTLFLSFEETPIASASIAQVHAATLESGRAIAVKVLRPKIRTIVMRDVAVLRILAGWMHLFSGVARQFKPKLMIEEFERTLIDELDMLREAANASQLRRNFINDPKLYVPEIFWPLCTKEVLVMERIHGVALHQREALLANGFDPNQIACQLVELFFTEVLRDCYFHADMHPGNIFAAKNATDHPIIIVVDFGIMGSLSAKDQRYLAENFLALLNRDYRRVAELHRASGWIPRNVRIDEFEANIRMLCEPIFERPLKDISFAALLLRLFETARRFHINIQPQLLLLQKTLFNIEGLARMLNPELDLFQTSKPVVQHWMQKRMGLTTMISRLKHSAPLWLEKLPELPGLFYDTLDKMTRLQEIRLDETTPSETVSGSKRQLFLGILLGMGLLALLMWFKEFLT